MKKKKVELKLEEFCPIRETIRLLGKQWTILVIYELYRSSRKTLSFMDLSRKLGDASSKVLSERLKEMVDDGLVKRRVDDSTKPPHVYYRLTKKGEDACMILDGFKKYGIRWGEGKTVDCSKINCELCPRNKEGQAVQKKMS